MALSIWTFFRILLFLECVLCLSIPPERSPFQETLLPDQDNFYKPTSDFAKTALGTILRSRPVPHNITLNNIDAIRPKNAWQLLYRTQNSVGTPTAGVVTVIEPWNAKKDHHLSYAYFSDAAYNGCNPSITLQAGTRDDNVWNQQQNAIVVQALELGYYVSVADFGGTQAAFSSGLQAAYSILDSLRAVHRSGELTGISKAPITTLHGYSSGAQAVGWATELHPTYAPEVKVEGAAFGGLVPNISALLEVPSYSNGSRAFLGPPVLLGISHDYANLSAWIDNALKPERAAEYRRGDQQCVGGNMNFTNVDLGQFFKRGYKSVFEEVPTSVVRSTGTQGERSTPTIPWYIYHAAADDVSPQALTDRLYHTHCRNGADILYEKNPLPLNHRSECIYGLTGAYQWMVDRHNQRALVKGCSTVSISNESLRGAYENLLIKGLISNLWAYMGGKIGPDVGWLDWSK